MARVGSAAAPDDPQLRQDARKIGVILAKRIRVAGIRRFTGVKLGMAEGGRISPDATDPRHPTAFQNPPKVR
jgi:hypothetical protein